MRTTGRGRLTVAVGMAVLAGALALAPDSRAAVPLPVHGAVVPSTPRIGWPRVENGSLEGADRVNQFLVYGGTFTSIRRPDGSQVVQPYVAAFDVDTGAVSPTFHPVLDNFVSVVEAGDKPGTVFIGGLFRTINGQTATRLAKLDVMTGQLVPGFSAAVDGEVTTLARFGDRLFVGGSFTKVNSQPRARLAEISAKTGALSSAFTIGVTGLRDSGCRADGFCYTMGGPPLRALRVTPNGSKLVVMHRGDQVGGLTRWGAAVIDISGGTPFVTPWRADLWDPFRNDFRTEFVGVIEGDISPDGTQMVFSNGIGNFPPLHDTVVSFPVSGGEAVQPLWVTQNFDSTYGVATSDQASYMGGHFCWTESQVSQASPLYWPGNIGNEYSCEGTSGSVFQPQTTARFHLAATDLTTGRALDWAPGSNNSTRGVLFLRTVDRGLVLGHDGTLVKGIDVGRTAFFDFGITKEPRELAAPTNTITDPNPGVTVALTSVSGKVTDDYRVKRVRVRLRDLATGQWVQQNGSLATTDYQWEATLSSERLSGQSRTWTVTGLPSRAGQIEITARAADLAGRVSPWVAVTVTGTGAQARVAAAAPIDTAGPDLNPRPAAAPVPAGEGGDPEPELLPWRLDATQATGLAIGADGTTVRVLKNGKIAVRDPQGGWREFDPLGAGFTGQVAIAGPDRIIAARKNGVWEWDGTKLSKLFKFAPTSLAIAPDGTVAVVNSEAGNAVVIRENGVLINDEPARWMAVEGAGRYWKIGIDGNVYRGRPGAWTQVGGAAIALAVTPSGKAAAILPDGTAAIYGADGQWVPAGPAPVTGAQVAVQDDQLFMLGADLNVYRLA